MTVEEFRSAYSLAESEARRLFKISGPSAVDLQALMNAKVQRAGVVQVKVPSTHD